MRTVAADIPPAIVYQIPQSGFGMAWTDGHVIYVSPWIRGTSHEPGLIAHEMVHYHQFQNGTFRSLSCFEREEPAFAAQFAVDSSPVTPEEMARLECEALR